MWICPSQFLFVRLFPLRRKLVLDRLLVVLPDILSTIELELDQVLEELKALIETLNLESDTTIFRPGQWAVIAGKKRCGQLDLS